MAKRYQDQSLALEGAPRDSSVHLLRSADLLAATLRRSNLGLLILDQDFQVVSSNPRLLEMLGHDSCPELLKADHCPELYHAVSRALRGETVQTELLRLPWRADLGHFQAECLPWELDESRHVIVLLQDDDERAALRQQLAEAHRFESLGRVAGSVAHDFNNLLTGIRGSLGLATQTKDDSTRQAAINAADRAAERAGQLSRQLLLYGRGAQTSAATEQPAAILRETAELVDNMPNTVPVELALDAELDGIGVAAGQLQRVVLNLLVNAQDAVRNAGRGDVSLRASVAHRPGKHGGPAARWLKVSVQDTGEGMDIRTKKHIFEPFFSTKLADNGTGLGLPSVQNIIEQAGGWLELETELARGSTFDVYLPVVKEGMQMGGSRAEGTDAGTTTPRVLICDDETRLATLTAGLLEEYGYESATVSLGDEALQLVTARNAPVDVLLLDVNLSAGLSADAVLDGMRESGSSIPVILTSGLAVEDLPPHLHKHQQVSSYLAKPYTVEELVDAIATAGRRRIA